MFQKISNIVMVVLLAACGVLGFFAWTQKTRADSAQVASMQYAGNASAHDAAAVEYRTIIKEKEADYEALDQALESNPVWADEPVPSDVANLLRHDSQSARAVP